MNQRCTLLLGTAVVLVGCGTRAATVAPPGAGTPPVTAAADTAPIRLAISISPEPSNYRVESRTAVFSASNSEVAVDSVVLSSTASLRLRREANGALRAAGTVDRLTVSSGLGSAKQTQTLSAPYSFEWTLSGDSIHVPARQASATCDQMEETARDILLSLLPPLPDTISRNESWRSNRSVESCRGGVAMKLATSASVNAGSLDSARAAKALPLQLTGQLVVSGSGSQGATNIILKGAGTVESTYLLNLSNGAIQSGNAESQLQLDFDLGYRTDKFIQRTRRTITRTQ